MVGLSKQGLGETENFIPIVALGMEGAGRSTGSLERGCLRRESSGVSKQAGWRVKGVLRVSLALERAGELGDWTGLGDLRSAEDADEGGSQHASKEKSEKQPSSRFDVARAMSERNERVCNLKLLVEVVGGVVFCPARGEK